MRKSTYKHGVGTQRNHRLGPQRNTVYSQNVNPSFRPAQRQAEHQDGGYKAKPQLGNRPTSRGQMYPGQSGGGYNANVNKRQMAYHHNNRSDGTNRRNMYNTNNAYFACDVLNEIYAAGHDSNCVSDLYSCVRDESDVLFSVYLNSENKKYTASRDSECFTSLMLMKVWYPKGTYDTTKLWCVKACFKG